MSTRDEGGQEYVQPEPVSERHRRPPPPQKIVLEQPKSMFGRFGKLLVAALILCILFIFGQQARYQSYFSSDGRPIEEKYHSLSKQATDKIAIVSLEGLIIGGDGFIKHQIDRVREDENVKAVVLRINSPGGTVSGSDFVYHHLGELIAEREIPLVVSMGTLCASGGYYAAMAVGDQKDVIYAEPTTWTGSIGVIIPHYDFSGVLESWNIENDSIMSHPLKDLGSFTKELSPEDREILQGLVDDSFDRFKDVVRSGRPFFRENDMALDAVATGQVFTAAQARDHGLVDKIGFVEDAIERAVRLAGLASDNVRVVKYKQIPGALDALFGAQTQANSFAGLDANGLLEMTAPRAFYIWSALPPLLTNTRAEN